MIGILQIRQTPGYIGIDADLGQFSIRQPKADMQIHTTSPQIDIHQEPAKLTIDQSAVRSAVTGGGNLEMTKRHTSNLQPLFNQNLARRVEQGKRMAEFWKPGNTIPQVLKDNASQDGFVEFRGPSSGKLVNIDVERREPQIEVQEGNVDIQVQVNKPEIEYQRGKLDIYVRQAPKVEFIPPEIDMKL
ncbi:DUF6470 family protein [Paenibacillus physcomitrellae]|uniref:Uncharacterized protein n=1 Tax=Paenibacillus physcomitrellae TaxID=1619311 RepID=A0ABQ1GGZ5_9BACL|nr:DUF6470 family protein [Paenibacillus physcomitrellae]GGA43680.1 hypothetical protein GCM10010917_31230 [Paenibacillus physcomitrellae]